MAKQQTRNLAEHNKSKVIFHCLQYLDTFDAGHLEQAIENLRPFASFYSVPLNNNRTKPDLKKSLHRFILNEQGYNDTITRLYNSLIN